MIDISKLKWSKHCLEGREERMMDILLNDGFGEIIAEFPQENNTIRCITDTGAVLIVGNNNTLVVTAYLLTYKLATYLFDDHIPPQLYQRIYKNYKHCSSLQKKNSKKG